MLDLHALHLNLLLQIMYAPKPGAEMRAASIQPLGTTIGKDSSLPQHYHKVTYTPEAEGLCQIEVKYDGRHVPGSPFAVQIRKACEPERVKVLGPGVEGPVLASLPVSFTVDARDAGMGDLTLGLTVSPHFNRCRFAESLSRARSMKTALLCKMCILMGRL